MGSKESVGSATHHLASDSLFLDLLRESPQVGIDFAFDLIKRGPFPYKNDSDERRSLLLALWGMMSRFDEPLSTYALKTKALKLLLQRLGHEFLEEIRWTGPGEYDDRVLNSVAVGMARMYHALPERLQKQLWGNKQEAQKHFTVLTRTIQYHALSDPDMLPARLGLESLLLGLLESRPTLLNADFDNPIRGPGEGRLVNPRSDAANCVYGTYRLPSNMDLPPNRSMTISGIPLSMGETEDMLRALINKNNRP